MPTNANPNSNAPNFTHRFAPPLARAIVRAWPTASREWGQAFAAELPSIDTATAAISWLVGLSTVILLWRKQSSAYFQPQPMPMPYGGYPGYGPPPGYQPPTGTMPEGDPNHPTDPWATPGGQG